MTKIIVYSKCPNDVEMRAYEHTTNDKGETIKSDVIGSCIIKGLNTYLRENQKKFIYSGMVAETLVDKDLWDKIVAERAIGDSLLMSKQIYTAKNEVEAKAILKDVERGISDLMTPAELEARKKQKPLQRPLI